jgi:hypothetical protein
MGYVFSWWSILQDINDKTPYVVIKDISVLCGVSILDLFKPPLIHDPYELAAENLAGKCLVVDVPLQPRDIPTTVAYINPIARSDWPIESLEETIMWLLQFSNNPVLPRHPHFYFGPQTPNAPKSYNSIMLYRLIKDRGMDVEYDITTEKLATVVSMMCNTKEKNRDMVYNLLLKMNHEDLIRIYMCCAAPANDYYVDVDIFDDPEVKARTEEKYGIVPIPETEEQKFTSLERVNSYLKDRDYIMDRIKPLTATEAIVLAARLYDKDISSAKDPISEYLHLKRRKEYIPLEQDFRAAFLASPDKFNLNVSFNPFLPESVYKPNSLHIQAIKEGYTTEEIDDDSPYSLLQVAYYSNTFYHGKFPLHQVNTTTLGDEDPIAELPNGVIVCFGDKSKTDYVSGSQGPKISMYAYRYRDLAKYFRMIGCFKNPLILPINNVLFDEVIFTDVSIKKLKGLCDTIYLDDTPEYIEERKDLLLAIIEVEVLNDENIQKMAEFRSKYVESDDSAKAIIRGYVTQLFTLAMYMRGWSGSGPYPIDKVIHDTEVNIAFRVTSAIIDIYRILDPGVGIPDIGKLFFDLPLYMYDEDQYIPSNDKKEGKTIGQRLEMVKRGESHTDMNSCINLSSGWLACTAEFIAESLDMDPLFDVKDFRGVS